MFRRISAAAACVGILATIALPADAATSYIRTSSVARVSRRLISGKCP